MSTPNFRICFPHVRVMAHCHVVIDSAILERIGRQHGVVSTEQLRDRFGWNASKLSRARRQGILLDVTAHVLRLASAPDTFELRCMALQLHLSERCFLGSTTAGRLYGLRSMPTTPVRATVPEATRRTCPPWAELARSSWFGGDDHIRRNDGLVVATPMRMLFGLAATLHPFRFARAAEDAWNLRLITPEIAADYLERHRCRGKNGVATMERWLDSVVGTARPAQSGLEQLLIDCLVRVGLPEPDRQHPIDLPNGETIHLDIAWPSVRLAVEPGAGRWHSGAMQQRRDQARDRACSEQDWHVVRFDESLRDDPMAAARQVQRIYRSRLNRNSEPPLRPAR
jgi:very-short-patch-repair endonuclease